MLLLSLFLWRLTRVRTQLLLRLPREHQVVKLLRLNMLNWVLLTLAVLIWRLKTKFALLTSFLLWLVDSFLVYFYFHWGHDSAPDGSSPRGCE